MEDYKDLLLSILLDAGKLLAADDEIVDTEANYERLKQARELLTQCVEDRPLS